MVEEKSVEQMIEEYAVKYGADVRLSKAISWCESGYQPYVKNPTSSAFGPYQIIKSTGEAWGIDRTIPEQNIEAGVMRIARGEVSHWSSSASCW